MQLEIGAEVIDSVLVLSISGDALDASNVQRFRTEVATKVVNASNVVLDFSKLNFVDSSGIGALLSALRQVNANNGSLKVACLRPNVESLFELVRMSRLLETFKTVELAIQSFSVK